MLCVFWLQEQMIVGWKADLAWIVMIQWFNVNHGETKGLIENSMLVGRSACIMSKHSLIPVSLRNPSENNKIKWLYLYKKLMHTIPKAPCPLGASDFENKTTFPVSYHLIFNFFELIDVGFKCSMMFSHMLKNSGHSLVTNHIKTMHLFLTIMFKRSNKLREAEENRTHFPLH